MYEDYLYFGNKDNAIDLIKDKKIKFVTDGKFREILSVVINNQNYKSDTNKERVIDVCSAYLIDDLISCIGNKYYKGNNSKGVFIPDPTNNISPNFTLIAPESVVYTFEFQMANYGTKSSSKSYDVYW